MFRALLAFVLAALVFAAPAEARRHKAHARPTPAIEVTQDLAQPVHAAEAAVKRGRRVLVVFDIDNTLLTTPQDLGGDAWFNWQRAEGSDDAQLLADSTLLLQSTRMDKTQGDAASLVAELQARHVDVYALSARGETLRGATLAVLADAKIDLTKAPECGPPLCVRRGYLNDQQIRAAARKLGVRLPATAFRPITVSDGVMLAAGQNKGLLLHLLLGSLHRRYDDVWFVDDTWQNVVDVQAEAHAMPARLHVISYRHLWPEADDFNKDAARQAKAQDDLKAFKAALCTAIRARTCPDQREAASAAAPR